MLMLERRNIRACSPFVMSGRDAGAEGHERLRRVVLYRLQILGGAHMLDYAAGDRNEDGIDELLRRFAEVAPAECASLLRHVAGEGSGRRLCDRPCYVEQPDGQVIEEVRKVG
jgi:hypothetical protein